MIKLIPRLKPNYDITDWLAALNIFQRNSIDSYEKEYAAKFENKFGVMYQHGRTGIYALLKIWGLNDDEVICPAYTCVVVPNAIVLSGNVPVFVDSASGSFNMDLDLLEKSISDKTRAIIVTHLFGYPMDVIRIQEIVDNAELKYGHKIYVIQDVAHSYGARWNGELVTRFGDAAIFGSNISKVINSIFGGMVLTQSVDTYGKLYDWRKTNTVKRGVMKGMRHFAYFIAVNIAFNSYIYGLVNKLERMGMLNRFVKYYDDDRIYFPHDWDEYPAAIEARVGRNQLNKYDGIIKKRVIKGKAWISKLQGSKIEFMPDIPGSTYSHCTGLVNNREKYITEYGRKGIQLGEIIEYSIPYMAAYKKYKTREYPVSLDYSKKSINFPNWV